MKKIVLILLGFIASGGHSISAQEFPPAPVNVVIAKTQEIAAKVAVSGNTISRNDASLAAEVSGRLVWLAEVGHQVENGAVIARIDDTSLKIQRDEHLANLANAKAKLKFLQSEVKRKSSLAEKNLSAKTDLDETISLRDVAEGDLQMAQAKLAQTLQNIDFCQLRAPFAGLVAQRLSQVGEYVSSNNAIIRLVETRHLEAALFAPLTAYSFLKKTAYLKVESPLGSGMAAIKALVPVANLQSHLMEVRLDMSQFDWPVGLNIKAMIVTGETHLALVVPRDALVLRREGVSLFRVNQDNKAEQLMVEPGAAEGDLVEVKGPVNPGDSIIIRGAERLQNGQTVQIKNNNDQLISGQSKS